MKSNQAMTLRRITSVAALLVATAACGDDVVRVDLAPSVIRDIGGVRQFDRSQFVTIHESPDANDLSEKERAVLRRLDVRYGRNGGLLSWQSARVPADPQNRDLPDVDRLKKVVTTTAKKGRPLREGDPGDHRDTVLCTHPEHMHAMPQNEHAEWGPRTPEGAAEFTAQFLKAYYTDKDRPRYLEVFNEPFVKAGKMGTTIEAMSQQHNIVARRVRQLCPDVKVGGYSAAWVELELNNFDHWDKRQKTFMDIAGEEMDFFSYHVYDGVNVEGTPRVRTGGNSEAIMDLIDSYSAIKFGVAKPILITEYGGIPEGGMEPSHYNARRTAGMLYSLVGQLMTYMDHPDRLEKVIPFILGKGEWTYTAKGEAAPGEANPFLLWRREEDGSYKTTGLLLFYRFLNRIEGQWRASRSSNPDVRVHLLSDKNRLLVLLMNLHDEHLLVALSGLEEFRPRSVTGRFLYTDGEAPVFGERKLAEAPRQIALRSGAAALLVVELEKPVAPESVVREHRVYATRCLKPIKAKSPVRFRFENVPTGDGTVVIRLSSGRPPGLAILPTAVRFNGVSVPVPDNWMGGDQSGRKNYYGMLEVPAPIKLAKPVSVVEVEYPDGGGKVASVVLQVNRLESLDKPNQAGSNPRQPQGGAFGFSDGSSVAIRKGPHWRRESLEPPPEGAPAELMLGVFATPRPWNTTVNRGADGTGMSRTSFSLLVKDSIRPAD